MRFLNSKAKGKNAAGFQAGQNHTAAGGEQPAVPGRSPWGAYSQAHTPYSAVLPRPRILCFLPWFFCFVLFFEAFQVILMCSWG